MRKIKVLNQEDLASLVGNGDVDYIFTLDEIKKYFPNVECKYPYVLRACNTCEDEVIGYIRASHFISDDAQTPMFVYVYESEVNCDFEFVDDDMTSDEVVAEYEQILEDEQNEREIKKAIVTSITDRLPIENDDEEADYENTNEDRLTKEDAEDIMQAFIADLLERVGVDDIDDLDEEDVEELNELMTEVRDLYLDDCLDDCCDNDKYECDDFDFHEWKKEYEAMFDKEPKEEPKEEVNYSNIIDLNLDKLEDSKYGKTELRTGQIVKLRNGKEYIVLMNTTSKTHGEDCDVLLKTDENDKEGRRLISLDEYDEQLSNYYDQCLDIMTINTPYDLSYLKVNADDKRLFTKYINKEDAEKMLKDLLDIDFKII